MNLKENAPRAEWEQAFDRVQRRRSYYESAKKKLPIDHHLVKHCKKKLEEAEAAYNAICAQL